MELTTAIDHIRPSVVQIRVDPAASGPGNRGVVVGTGFWAHPEGLVLTARHVSRDAQAAIAATPGARLRLGLAIPNLTGPPITIRSSFEIMDVEILEEDPRHDVALLRAPNNPFTSGRTSGVHQVGTSWGVNALFGLASLSDQAVRDGEGIAVSGYPLAEPALVTTSGAIASAFGSDIQEIQAAGGPAGFLVPDSADSYLADVAVNPGNSGGPVYRIADGSVLGVCVAFRIAAGTLENHPSPFFYNSGLSVVVPIKYGQSLIARHASTAAAD
jgi:S1-C subfamily serine protease